MKRTVKKVKKPLIIPVNPREPCKIKGCKTITAYMKHNRDTGKMQHWCAVHFDEYVVKPDKERAIRIVAEGKANAARRERILATQKGTAPNLALKPAAKRAMKSASKKPRRVVKKKVKK